eukprot:5569513-Pyramimonas_sp.AAC.1
MLGYLPFHGVVGVFGLLGGSGGLKGCWVDWGLEDPARPEVIADGSARRFFPVLRKITSATAYGWRTRNKKDCWDRLNI